MTTCHVLDWPAATLQPARAELETADRRDGEGASLVFESLTRLER